MESFLPTGPGIFYERQNSGKFLWNSLLPKTPEWSWPAIAWLNYWQNDNLFKDVVIRHVKGLSLSLESVYQFSSK